MNRSVSEPSLRTQGTMGSLIITERYRIKDAKVVKGRGYFLFEGRCRKFTMALLMSVWNPWFQGLLLLTLLYQYIVHLLLGYFIDHYCYQLELSIIITEAFYSICLFINILHMHWPLVRHHARIYRRNYVFLLYDAISLFPGIWLFRNMEGYEIYATVFRWLSICRIYRIGIFIHEINGQMQESRKLLLYAQQIVLSLLFLHGSTCLWYNLNRHSKLQIFWPELGPNYPPSVNTIGLTFDSYSICFYYCTCRFFNCIFGDSFPLHDDQKWTTSVVMLIGYVFCRYRFIGALAWEMVVQTARKSNFVDQYRHMTKYLTNIGAPNDLIEECKNYKHQLWIMKDGVQKSHHLNKLPLSMQMALIFDINVGHFHSSLLFRNTSESFMRQISLLMRHEFYLAGQTIWSQGVVKSGMICIKRGVIEMLSDEDDESPMIAFKDGTVLGELSLFHSIPSKVTVKAATYVELQTLRRTDFMRVLSEHQRTRKLLRNKIMERLSSSKNKKEAIDAYDKGDLRLIRTRYRPMKVLKDNLVGVEAEDPTFVDDSYMYYLDKNKVRQPKFTGEYLELYKLSPNVTTIDTPPICVRSTFPWILTPDTELTRLLDVIHFCIVLYLCFVCPYAALQSSTSDTERSVTTIVTSGLLFNIYVQLTTAIVKKNVRKETMKEIAEAKMASFGFYMDVIAVFPMYIFTETLDPMGQTIAHQLAELLPILQVWHIWNYLNKWANSFDSHGKIFQLIKFFLVFVMFAYWSGCFLFLYACPVRLCRENTWMMKLIYSETKVFMTNEARHESPLTTALAFGTAVYTGSGSSEISPGSSDLYVVIIIFILGSYLCYYYTSQISCNYLLSTQRRIKFKESMRELFYFLSVNRVSGKIKARVKNFFLVQWYYNNAVSTFELFEDMSRNIQQEVLSLEMVKTLKQCPLFQHCNRDFLQTVASNTRQVVLPDNEVIQHAADIGRYMYILKWGHCNLITHNGKLQMSIGPGGQFGVLEMLFGLPKVYTVVTTTNCILLHIEYSTLVQCWGTFPDISHPIIKVLSDTEIKAKAQDYEQARPLSGKIDIKTNRIKQEIKESFTFFSSPEEHGQFLQLFNDLKGFRYVRYLFIPGSITPHGIFLKLWCGLRFILAVYYILFVPYEIATRQDRLHAGYSWFDLILYLDLVVMVYVSYYNEKQLLVTHPLLTMARYLKQSLAWDLLCVFPFEAIVYIISDSTEVGIYRINRMLMVSRITGAFSYWENNIMSANLLAVLVKFIPIAVTIINLATAFIFVNACKTYLPDNSTFILVNCSKVLILEPAKFEPRYAIAEYAFTFYWVFEIFVGMGCTPVYMTSSVDPWLVMALQLTGFLYFSFMFGYVASTRSAAAHSLLRHKEKTKDLANFLYEQNVDPMLTRKTLKYFEYVWKRTNGSDPQNLCRRLNASLMEDTLVFMYEKALREVPLFGKVERSFIRVITQHLHEMYLLKGDTVIQYRDVQPYIYIIYRGKVDVLTSYNEMITCMGPGGMFGNFTGKPISSSDVTIYASRSIDLLVIPSVTFFNLIKYYPKIQEPLKKAFETSKDYILPITMEVNDDDSLDEVDSSEDSDIYGEEATSECSSYCTGNISMTVSQSDLSQGTRTSASIVYSIYAISNFLRPGTLLFQYFGYCTCAMVTIQYLLELYNIVTLNNCYILSWIHAFLDIFFYVKIYLNMHKGYMNKSGFFVINSTRCRRQYFRRRLLVWSDVLANMPIELFGFCFPDSLRIMHLLRINRLFRLKYLLQFYMDTSRELTNNLTTLQVVMTMTVTIVTVHTAACLWLMTMMYTSPIIQLRNFRINMIDEENPQYRWDYVTSFYLIVCQLTATGCDEFKIVNIVPMIIISVVLVCGKMMAAIIVAVSIQLAYATKYALTNYETDTKEMIDMLKNQGLSSYQLTKFWAYIQKLWVTDRGRQLPSLLAQTPYVRRCNLMSAMFGHYLRNCYVFADTGESFLRQLTVVLEYTTFFPGNYIVVAGDSEARMYWVASGKVAVVSVRPDLTEVTHEYLVAGNVFGILQGLNKGTTHSFSYRAETKVSIIALSLDSWINILPFFPEAKKVIQDRSEVLFTQI